MEVDKERERREAFVFNILKQFYKRKVTKVMELVYI